VPPILNMVTGRLQGEKPDESTGRRKKRARLARLDEIDSSQEQDVSQTSLSFPPADWTPSQEQDFTGVSSNVDPGLAMPQGN
jgi:hypothetical protein